MTSGKAWILSQTAYDYDRDPSTRSFLTQFQAKTIK